MIPIGLLGAVDLNLHLASNKNDGAIHGQRSDI